MWDGLGQWRVLTVLLLKHYVNQFFVIFTFNFKIVTSYISYTTLYWSFSRFINILCNYKYNSLFSHCSHSYTPWMGEQSVTITWSVRTCPVHSGIPVPVHMLLLDRDGFFCKGRGFTRTNIWDKFPQFQYQGRCLSCLGYCLLLAASNGNLFLCSLFCSTMWRSSHKLYSISCHWSLKDQVHLWIRIWNNYIYSILCMEYISTWFWVVPVYNWPLFSVKMYYFYHISDQL